MELRPYQNEAISAAREKLRAGAKSCLIICPTGGGKTVIAASIISSAEARGSRALFLAHRRELIDQTADKLTRFGVAPGIILAGRPLALHRATQVASVQSLVRKVGNIGRVDLIFVDEAHHASADSYQQILKAFPAAVVIGLTATPWRQDGAGLGDIFDAHVLVRTPRQLRDEGHLVGVTGWEYAPIDTRSAKVAAGDFVGKSLEGAAMAPKLFGEIITEWKTHAGGARTVLFGCTIRHSQAMAEAFRAAGVAAEHLDGETPKDLRASILSRIRTGETRVLCNVNVATEGWDCPELECIVLARPTLSTALYLQMVGRVLRPNEGKMVARIHDHARCLAAHGHPYAERDFSPEKATKGSRKMVESTVRSGRRCEKCNALIAATPCDGCGFQPTQEQIEATAAAERRAIYDTPAWREAREKVRRQEEVTARFRNMSREEKRAQYLRLVEKHGARKALGVYRWMSGDTEWPPMEWRLEPNVEAPR